MGYVENRRSNIEYVPPPPLYVTVDILKISHKTAEFLMCKWGISTIFKKKQFSPFIQGNYPHLYMSIRPIYDDKLSHLCR